MQGEGAEECGPSGSPGTGAGDIEDAEGAGMDGVAGDLLMESSDDPEANDGGLALLQGRGLKLIDSFVV